MIIEKTTNDLKNRNILFLSQVRLSSIDKVPGKAFHEARNWSKYCNQVVFLCFSDVNKYFYKRFEKNFLLIAIPFNLSKSMNKTIATVLLNYLRLLKYLYKIVKICKIDLIREENLIINGIPTLIISKITKVPFTTWLGGFEREAFEYLYKQNLSTKFIKYSIIFLEFLIFKTSSMVFTVSKSLYELIGKRNTENRFLSPNYVDFSIFTEKEQKIKSSNEKISIIYSGRFEQEKGIDNLLKAINIVSLQNKNFELRLVGYGSMEVWIRDFIKSNNLEDSVKLLGKFQLSEMPINYKNADIFVIPSYTEGLPAALLEAMCSGCACICTNVGIISEYIFNEKNGLIVEPGKPDELASAFLSLINNPKKIYEFGKQTRALIEKKSGRYLKIHSKIYQYIINNHYS